MSKEKQPPSQEAVSTNSLPPYEDTTPCLAALLAVEEDTADCLAGLLESFADDILRADSNGGGEAA